MIRKFKKNAMVFSAATVLLLGFMASSEAQELGIFDQNGINPDDMIWLPRSGKWNWALCESSWGADDCDHIDNRDVPGIGLVPNVSPELNDKASSFVICNWTGAELDLEITFYKDSDGLGSSYKLEHFLIPNDTCIINNKLRWHFNDQVSSYSIYGYSG